MCVSGVRSGAVSCECVCVSCEWASRRSSVVRREAFFFALRFVWDSEVFVSSFSFEFVVEIFVSNFEFKCLEFSCRILKSNFDNLQFRFVALFDFSNFNFRFEFRIQVPWFFDSNLSSKFLVEIFDVLIYSTSRISLCLSTSRSSLLNSTSRISLLNSISRSSTSRVKSLEFDDSNLSSNFEFVLIYSTSRTSIRIVVEIVVEIVVFVSHSSFEFLIELFNFRRNCWFLTDVVNYSRTIALASLSLPRELCARFSCVKY